MTEISKLSQYAINTIKSLDVDQMERDLVSIGALPVIRRDYGITAADLSDEEYRLRRLLFFNHSSCKSEYLYGDDGEMHCDDGEMHCDDGEMHCHECNIDFVRDTAEEIEDRIAAINLGRLSGLIPNNK